MIVCVCRKVGTRTWSLSGQLPAMADFSVLKTDPIVTSWVRKKLDAHFAALSFD